MSHCGPDLHFLGHLAVDGFRLHGATRKELAPVPFRNASWRAIDATAKAPLVWPGLLLERVVRVAFHLFHSLNVNPVFRLLDELFPTLLSRQWRTLAIVKIKVCFQLRQFRIDGKVRADEIAILRSTDTVILESKFEKGNPALLVVAQS